MSELAAKVSASATSNLFFYSFAFSVILSKSLGFSLLASLSSSLNGE